MRIEQLLHGYQDGHGRLAGTLYSLSPRDTARISMMSDWSGFKDPDGKDHSYITAYYLEDSGMYVVSKSWYAQEMERPGCVWTPSLLFNLNELPPSFDFRNLLSFFLRPKKGEYGVYNKPIEVDDGEKTSFIWEGKKPDRVSLMFILSTLLAGNERFYMKAELEPWWYQQLCLTILQFIPIEMLRRISISSGGAAPRKMDDDLLSMQFVSLSEAISLLTPPWEGKLKESDFNIGLSLVARAMMGDGSDVSTLIRVFSNDIGNDGKKYLAVCQLIGTLYLRAKKISEVNYADVLNIIITYFPTQEEGKLVKDNFLGRRITELFCTNDNFLFLIATLDHLEDHVTANQMMLDGRIQDLPNEGDGKYIALIERILSSDIYSEFGRQILSNSYNHLNPTDIEILSDDQWKGLIAFWGVDQDYLLSNKWLGLHGERFNDVLWRFAGTTNDIFPFWNELLEVILGNDAYVDDMLVDKLYEHVDGCASKVLNYLNANNKILRYDNLHVRPFRDGEVLTDWLKHQEKVTSLVETFIVNYVWPSDYHIRISEPKIWHWMLDNDNGKKNMAYYVFMYEIAWQWKGNEMIDFYQHCFHKVHNGLADYSMSDRIWNRVYSYGGKVSLFQEWDRCLKLRKGLVGHLKDLGCPRSLFINLTPDTKLNESLLAVYDKMS